MAELNDILASGSVPAYKRAAFDVVDAETFPAHLAAATADGINVPELADDTAAANGTMFWNLATGKLQYKSPGGIVLQFTMTLAP